MTAGRDARANGKWQGSHWIRDCKRLAIHLRDGLSCVYCGDSVETGAQLSLDHVVPHSKGGTNSEKNLVTCCTRCNARRGNRDIEVWAKAVAEYNNHGITAEMILADIAEMTGRKLRPYREEAKAMIERRGTAARVLASIK